MRLPNRLLARDTSGAGGKQMKLQKNLKKTRYLTDFVSYC